MGCNCRKRKKPTGMGVNPTTTSTTTTTTKPDQSFNLTDTKGSVQTFGSKLERDAARVRMTSRR